MVDRLEQVKAMLKGDKYPFFPSPDTRTFQIDLDDFIQELRDKGVKIAGFITSSYVEYHEKEGLPSCVILTVKCQEAI